MAHKGHSICEFSSKATCDKAARIAIGQCTSMIEEDRQCDHWGIDKVEGRPYCGVHIATVYLAADRAKRDREYRAAMDARIDRALLWHREHPSIHDHMPEGWMSQ